MASPEEMAASMLRNLPEKTGKTLKQWKTVLKNSGLGKHGEMVKLLKQEHGVTHGFANLIATQYRTGGEQPAEVDLVTAQYSGAKADLKPIYDAVVKAASALGQNVEVSPKKAYVSLRARKQFALVQPSTRTRVDIGLNLPDVAPTDRLEKSGSFNAMVSHRVRITSVKEVNAELKKWLKQAWEGAQ